MGHAAQGAGPDGTDAPDLEGALGADAGHGGVPFSPPEVFGQFGPGVPGPTPERGRTCGQPALALLRHQWPHVLSVATALLADEPGREREGEVETHAEAVGG